jgi:ComF family protein
MRETGADVLNDADAVIPVPLSRRRALTRGFNQADDLARLLGPPVWRVLRRRRHGLPQAGLPASDRHANVKGAYGVSWLVHAPFQRPLPGTTVVLIDDVMTTGATLEECARVVQAAGVASVRALTIARAAAPGPRSPRPL